MSQQSDKTNCADEHAAQPETVGNEAMDANRIPAREGQDDGASSEQMPDSLSKPDERQPADFADEDHDTEQSTAPPAAPTLKRLLTYAGPKDYWNAFYSILLIIVASHFLGRLPYLPIAILMALPFLYMTALGILFLVAETFLHRTFPDPRHALLQKTVGPQSVLVRAFRRDGPRFLRTAFAVGVYLLAGLVYLALGPDENPVGWILLPCLLIAMVALFSIDQHARAYFSQDSISFRSIGRDVRKSILRRGLFVLITVGALLALYILLLRPLRLALMR